MDSQQAQRITSEVHDLWFDADALLSDPIDGQVHVPLYNGRSRRHQIGWSERPPDPQKLPSPVGVLVIRSVRALTVDDRADIGWYSVDRFEFDRATSVIRIECNQPLVLSLSVSEFDAELTA